MKHQTIVSGGPRASSASMARPPSIFFTFKREGGRRKGLPLNTPLILLPLTWRNFGMFIGNILSTTLLCTTLKQKRRHSVCVRRYLKHRDTYGSYNCLMKNLRMHDTDKLRNHIRMELPVVFEELLSKVEPRITSQSTKFTISHVCIK